MENKLKLVIKLIKQKRENHKRIQTLINIHEMERKYVWNMIGEDSICK